MQNRTQTLAAALIAGLISGGVALADDTAGANSGNATPESSTEKPAPSTTKTKRKPHREIKNKNSCCKNGCGCMDEKGAQSDTKPGAKSDTNKSETPQ